MFVSIRDVIVMTTGFDSLHEALTFYDLRHVEMVVEKDLSVRSLQPTAEQPRLFLDRKEDVEKLGRETRGAGITITAFLVHNDFNAADPETHINWVAGTAEAAAHLGVPVVRIDSIMTEQKALSLERRIEVFSEAVKTVLERSARLKVSYGIENHGAQGNDPAFLDGVLQKVGSHRLGLTLDVGNFYWSGKPLSEVYRLIQRYAPRTLHTHIKNIAYPAELRETERAVGFEYSKYVCPIPDGDLDMVKIVGLLKKSGYRNDLCIEDESLGKFDLSARQNHVKAAIAVLRKAIG